MPLREHTHIILRSGDIMRVHGLIALVATAIVSYSPPGFAQAAPGHNSPSVASCAVGWVDPAPLGNGSSPAVSVNGPSRMLIEINQQTGTVSSTGWEKYHRERSMQRSALRSASVRAPIPVSP